MSGAPRLSVVIPVVVGVERLRDCLAALERQAGGHALEAVVPVDSRFDPGFATAIPWVRVERFEGAKTSAELRALGIARTRGEVVALTEDHCLPAPDWCDAVLAAHAAPHAAIGGAMEKEERRDDAVGWALYFADYVRYAAPFEEGPSHALTDCNVSYKRAALDAVAPSWAGAFHEPEVHAALRRNGAVLWRSPLIVVRERRAMTWRRALADRWAYGRLFGALGSAGLPAAGRLRRAALTLAVLPVLVARSGRHALRSRRYAARFAASLPALLLLDTAWALGELLGALTARGSPEAGGPR